MLDPNRRRFKSVSQPWVPGSHINFDNFVPAMQDGMRVVIEGFTLVADLSDVTVTTTAVAGEDAARAFKRIEVIQLGGRKRWNLAGDESRVMAYKLDGPERYHEISDIAAAANQAATVEIYIPMKKRFAKGKKDYSLPADLLENLRIECADETELRAGEAGAVTVNSASYYVIAECRLAGFVGLYAEDEVYAQNLQTAGGKLTVNGRLQELAIFKRGAGGGASMSNFTGIRIEGLIPKQLNRDPDLVAAYRRARHNSSGAHADDPFTAGRAVPVLWSDEETSVFDGKLASLLELELENTVADPKALCRVVKPRSEDVQAAVERHFGIPRNVWRVKTEAKTKRDPSKWPADKLRFLPMSAPLRGAPR